MSGTPRAGYRGRVMIDTSSAGNGAAVVITSKAKWTVDMKVDTFEVTALEDSNKTYVVGLADAQGTIEGYWDSGDNNAYNLINSSVARKLYIYPDATNNVTSYFFTTSFFSVKADGAVNSPVNASLTWNAASVASWVHP